MLDTESRNGDGLGAVPDVLSERVKQLQLGGKLNAGNGGGSSTAWLPWILCVLMAIAWAGVGIRFYRPASVPTAPSGPPGAPGSAPAANLAKKDAPRRDAPAAKPDEPVLDAKGYIIPAHQIAVSPIEVVGRVVELNIEEGKLFKKGQVLAKLEDTGYRADYEESVAAYNGATERYRELKNGTRPDEIEQAKAELSESIAMQKQYELEWKRFQTSGKLGVSTREFDQAESNYRAQEQRITRLRKTLKLLEDGPREERIKAAAADAQAADARMRRSKWRLDNCIITSPVDGVILTKKAEIGSLINPVVGSVSTGLCEIADLADLEVDMEIQERDIAKVFDGQYCRIKSDAYPDRPYVGYVDRAMPIANRARGIIPIRVKVVVPPTEKQGSYLKPEMGVSVTFFNKKYDPAKDAAPKAGETAAPSPKEPEPRQPEAKKEKQ